MPKVLKILIVLVVLSSFATVGLIVAERTRSSADALLPDPSATGLSIPDFTLTAQDGTTFTKAALASGQVTVVDFFFTSCPFICPTLTSTMYSIANDLRDTPVRFLSISVDPKRDTPERLTEYAKQHSADLRRWTFATGNIDTIRSIITGGLKFELSEVPNQPINLPGGETMNNIRHPSWLALIGPKGEVLGIYRSSEPGDVEMLKRKARAAAIALAR
jgi:protein SCO1/2